VAARPALDRLTARRLRVGRQARILRLMGRNGLRWARSRVRGLRAGDERRAELDAEVALRTAEDVARELGDMKGAVMKLGQLVSFIAEGLPAEAQAALAQLQQDVPPMAPGLAASVVRDELGEAPERLFLDWQARPAAAASIGQVHRAVLADGRDVAVKVQYPGVGAAIRGDLANAEALYGMLAATAMKGLDAKGIVGELRERMLDELDYRLEARNQTEFAEQYRGHPFARVPAVVTERSSERVLTSEWVEGRTWSQFQATATPEEGERAAEVLFRFAQRSIHRLRAFNGDPHPGNYRFGADGAVTFLDFGLVKRWSGGEWETLAPVLDLVLAGDAPGTVRAMEAVGFIRADHGLTDDRVFGCVSAPYTPYLTDEYTFSRTFTRTALDAVFNLQGPYGDVIPNLRLPPSFVILHRVVWGVSALLGRLGATNRWRAILDEYRLGTPPATELGEIEAAWARGRQR
jgi:predicted unusual protein kinase regulating ubiquinone biosynthesis (AarF/ABC1/UbiB family)